MFQTKSGRPISYYGQDFQGEVVALKENTSVKTIDDFFTILLECWCKDTAYPSSQNDYDYETDPTYGQCAITATLFYDIFGGTIHKIKVAGGGTHYFNKVDDRYFDLTSDQFELYDIPVQYEPNQVIDREYCGRNQDTFKRYSILKQRIIDYIKARPADAEA